MCSRMKPAARFSWKSNVFPRTCELRKYNCYEPWLFIACGWAASHRCRPTSQGKCDFEVTRCLVHFVWGLGALRAPRPGQRFLAILADQFGDKVAKTVFSSHRSIPFLKHDALDDVQAHIWRFFPYFLQQNGLFSVPFAFFILICLWFFPLKAF